MTMQLFYFSAYAVLSVDEADSDQPENPELRGLFADRESADLAARGFETLRRQEHIRNRPAIWGSSWPIGVTRYVIIPVKNVMVNSADPLSDLREKLEDAARLQLAGVGVSA